MSTIKISELATSNIALTDFFAKADATGVANKNTVQELSNLLKTVDDTAFKGSIAIADVPSENGWYFASESGTYTNCGGLVIDTADNIAIIIVSGTFDTFNKIDIPVNITIDATPLSGSLNAVESGGVFDSLKEISKNNFFTPLTDKSLLRLEMFLDIKFTNNLTPDSILESDNSYKNLYIKEVFNTPTLQTIDVTDGTSTVCEIYETNTQKSGKSVVSLTEVGGSGISMECYVNWDSIANYFAQNTTEIELNTELIAGRSDSLTNSRLNANNKKFAFGLPYEIGTYRTDSLDSDVIITNLKINFISKENAFDTSGKLKRLFFSFIRNNASNAIIRIADETGFICQYGKSGNQTGVQDIILSEESSSGVFASLTIDFDALLGSSYETTTLAETEINPNIILSALDLFSGIPYPLNDNSTFLLGTTDKIAFSDLQFFFKEPEKAYKADGTLKQFYFDFIRNKSTSNLFIRIQEVGNVTANGICYVSDVFQTGIQTFEMRERDNSGIYCRLTVDCDVFTDLESNPTASTGLISDEVVLKGVNYSNYLGIEKISENRFPNVVDKIPNFKTKLLAQEEDLHIIWIGDSLIAKTDVTHDNGDLKPNLPPSCTNRNTFYNSWKNIVKNKPDYDRYDSAINAFTEVGTWAVTSSSEFDSPTWTGEFREQGELTKKSVTANASFAFDWSLDSYEKLNLIHRKGINGTSVATMVITEGINKVEVLNDSNVWVEANSFVINQFVDPAVATEGSGYAQYLGNYRLKLRKKSGAIGSVTITVSKGNNAETLYFWGTERWNGITILMSNLARAGRYIDTFNDVYLNDIYPRNPDLIMFEIPLVNECSSNLGDEQGIYDDLQDLVWGDRAGNLNANSFKNISNNWADFEVVTIIPHTSSAWLDGDKPTVISNGLTAVNVYNRTKNLINYKGDIAFIDMNNVMKREGKKRNRNYQQALTGNNDQFFPFFTFTYDPVHQNDFGSLIWSENLSSIFYDLI